MTVSAARPLTKPKERTLEAFLLALGVAFLLFLPFLIIDRGYFIYYGDFNVQQIPFYRMAHDAVRSGDIFWNWYTDLGANFIGSYSFYLLGSPFFWLTLAFPSSVVPYLMGPLLILKFACSSLTAYLYLRRFVRPDYAVLGGLLYAFSGFSVYNVFFNHFHEAIIYFPLMLLGMELYMKDGKRGIFAISVFLSALSNYYFFIGQAIFLILYWFVRMLSGAWNCTLSKFLWLFFEAIIGTAGAAVLLLPSYYAVIQNPRTESILGGWDFLIYNKPQRFYDVIHSFFFPQDIPARENFFPDSDNKWASMSAWLPVFGCSGAIAYFQSRKHTDWLRRMLIICFFCAIIPGLNAMFQLFNWAYYARWYYMMVAMLVLATVLCLEEAEEKPVEWKRAFGWSFGITAAFALFIGLMPKSWTPDEETGQLSFGLMKDPGRFWIYVAIAIMSLVLAALLINLFHHDRPIFYRWSIGVVVCVSLIYSWYFIGLGKANSNYSSSFVIEQGIEGGDQIHLPDAEETVRVDMNEGMDNQAMFWGIPTINAFHSIVPGSVMEFYPTIGVSRGVGSRPEAEHYALRSLTSTRWLFDYADNPSKKENQYFSVDGETKMPGWTYYDKQNGFLIYENQYYIPMGFTYTNYLTRSAYEALPTNQRELALLKALVIEDGDETLVSRYLSPFQTETAIFSETAYYQDCEARRAAAASSFARDTRGFTATISLDRDNLVFFSVPYEGGWSATVNGQEAPIFKTNVGFMAVACPAGQEVTIRFNYMTPGLLYGCWISLGAVLLFVVYLLLMRLFDRRMRKRIDREFPPLDADTPPRMDSAEDQDSSSSYSAEPPRNDAAAAAIPGSCMTDFAPSSPAAMPSEGEDPAVPHSETDADDTFDLYRIYRSKEDASSGEHDPPSTPPTA